MSTPVLATKLYIPPPRPNVVSRPRLTERLNGGLHRKLSLVSAPAGSGKTTLLSEWVTSCGRPAAWLSLDGGDSDPARFLAHVVAALRTRAADMGTGVLEGLHSPQPPSTEAMLSALLNEISRLPEGVVLVLDDYHLIDAGPVDSVLTFLLDHAPPQLHLVIATREDPRLPLARLRAGDQLTELRAGDLRFTALEAAEFLNGGTGLRLTSEDIDALEDRTEGWIAGLQLAALSMQGREDASDFVSAFSGDHRYIADYLVDEVLRRQPDDVRKFLLRTSILDRLTGPLCDAVTGQGGGATRLEALERANLFVVPLDDQRRWYRYHHLFAEVLAGRLRAEDPDSLSILHRRASEWYERHGSPADAIRHALYAEDFERAASLVERAIPETRRSRQEALVFRWLTALPDDLIRVRPVLSVAYAWSLLATGHLEDVESRLSDAQRLLDSEADRAGMVVVDGDELGRLPAAIAVYRSVLAQARGDVAATMAHARQALGIVPEDDDLVRGAAAALLGLAAWASGDLETAHRTYAEGMARVLRAGNISDAINGTIALADIHVAQGRLREAFRTYEGALQRAMAPGEPVPWGTPDLHVGMSELYRERNDLEAAEQHLILSKELSERARLPQNRSRWCVAMARILEAHGDLDAVLDLLDEAERLYVSDLFPNVRPIAAVRARMWLAQGRVDEALGWAREHAVSAEDDLSYLREFEHITLARLLLAQHRTGLADRPLGAALGLLERLLDAAVEGKRTGSAIEILVLLALAHEAQGDITAAHNALERALKPAEPEGYVRVFVDEGRPMARLLREVNGREAPTAYTSTLLAALQGEQRQSTGKSAPSTLPVSCRLIEPLSDRELDVLRLLQTELSGPEIARELMVALSTIRTHTKSIYSKFGVSNRRAAVKRAAELGLI